MHFDDITDGMLISSATQPEEEGQDYGLHQNQPRDRIRRQSSVRPNTHV